MGSRLTHQEEEIINVSFQAFATQVGRQEESDEIKEVIDVYKLVEAFQNIDASSDIEDIKLLIADIDENGDADIDLQEWRHIMSRKFLGEEDDSSFTHVFSMLDDDKDGHIPLVEFRKMLMEEGQAPLSEQEVDELLMFADTDSDGLINYRKFLKWLSNPEGYHKDQKEQHAAMNATKQSLQGPVPGQDRGAGVGALQPGGAPKAQGGVPPQQQQRPQQQGGMPPQQGHPNAPKAKGPGPGPAGAPPAQGPPAGAGGPPKAAGPGPGAGGPPGPAGSPTGAATPGGGVAKAPQAKGLMSRPVAKAKAPAGTMSKAPSASGSGGATS